MLRCSYRWEVPNKHWAGVNASSSKRRKDRMVSNRMAQPPPSRWLKSSAENEHRHSRTSDSVVRF